MELEVSLQFECCQCNQPVGVTLKCEGKGLLGGFRTIATVKIPCPGCGLVNQLFLSLAAVAFTESSPIGLHARSQSLR